MMLEMYNAALTREHGEPSRILTEYMTSGDFVERLLENWDSELLQMGMYVVLAVYLFQKGSPSSSR
jgi:hypothetical protein